MPFVFYDTETTGLEPEFDQILQFAAIKTDDNLNELVTFNVRCRLLPYVVPAPSGLLITRIPIRTLTDSALPSCFDAVASIRNKMMEWSPATFVGWNTIEYDEELLRHSLFQSLFNPYLTNTNGNCRGDIMRVAFAANVYAPNSIVVPLDDKGNPIFKLKALAEANGFQHDQAHEALSDVRMTINIARLIKQRAPAVWDAMMNCTRKITVFERCVDGSVFVLTERWGNLYHYLVTPCGRHGNQDLAVFDLQFNPDEFVDMPVEALVEVLKKSPKPIRALRAHKQPILMDAGLAPNGTKALTVYETERRRRAQVIVANTEFRRRVSEAMAQKYVGEPSPEHLEQRLYSGGFLGNADTGRCDEYHGRDWPDRCGVAGQFEDERVKEFAYRLIYAACAEALDADQLARLKQWERERVMAESDVPWTTVPSALAEIDELLAEATGADAVYLAEIKTFIQGISDRVNPPAG